MTNALRRWAVPAACMALSLFGSSSARAFCRTNTCDPARGENCSVDKDGCRQGGKSLYWGLPVVPFLVQADGSPKNHIDATSFEKVIANAFNTWSSANCGAGKHPSISAMSGGQTPSSVVEYIQGQPNANIFMFRDDTWMATIPGSALALTTVSYDSNTGRIYDADVEVNGTGGNITNGRPTDGADLPSIITHELGHFLGLDHSPKPTATMFITYKSGIGNLRVLDPDDIAGVCTIYPPQGRVAAAAGPQTIDVVSAPLAGCSLSSGARPGSSARLLWVALVLGAVLFRTRSRKRRAYRCRVSPACRRR
jgi:hypothetical protein